jgi:MFS family permease
MTDAAPQPEADPAVQVFSVAPMDHRYRAYSVLVLALAAAVVAGLIFAAAVTAGTWRLVFIIAACVMAIAVAAVTVLVRLYSRPKHFELSDEGLRIVWPARSRKLPRNAFSEARLVTETELGRLSRCFGMTPLMGTFGWFRSEYMGSMDVYITRHLGLVYLRMANRHPLLLTPCEPETFLAALKDIANRVD